MAKKDIDVHVRAHDQLTRNFRKARRESAGLGRSLGKLAGIAAGFVGFRAIARMTVGAIRESVMFEKQLAEVSTLITEDLQPTMARFKDELKAMAVEFGQSKETLARGLYDILSAEIPAEHAIEALTVATKAAIGGVTDTATAVKALVAVMTAYGLEAKDFTKISNLMFSTVKGGVVTYEELAENIGKIAAVAHSAKVPLEDLFGILTAAVKVEKPERAFTAIRAALMTAAKEGRNFLEVVREMRGATLEQILAGQKQKKEALGLFGVVEEGGKKAIVFAKRAAVGVSILTGNIDEMNRKIEDAKNSAGLADTAFQKMADTNFQKISKMGQAWANVKTEIGDAIVETEGFQTAIELIMRTIRKLRGKKPLPEPIRPGFGFQDILEGIGIGDVGKEIKTLFGPVPAKEIRFIREVARRRAELKREAAFRAEPGIEKAPSPLETIPGMEVFRGRLYTTAGAQLARRELAFIEKGPSPLETVPGMEVFQGRFMTEKMARRARRFEAGEAGFEKVPERRKQLTILEKIEVNTRETTRNTEVTVEGRSFR